MNQQHIVVGIVIGLVIGAAIGWYAKPTPVPEPTGVPQAQYDTVVCERDSFKNKATELQDQVTQLNKEVVQLENQIDDLQEQLTNLPTFNTSESESTNGSPTQPTNATEKTISRLHAEGNKLIDEDSDTITLRGVNVVDIGNSQTIYRFPWAIELDYKEIKYNWAADVVRLPLHPGQWESRKNDEIKWIDFQVQLAKELNMYLILDYHAIGNPAEPNPDEDCNPDINIALDFWDTMAARYADEEHVIYEIFNEPVCSSWNVWREYAQQLVDKIREHAPDTLLVVGGIDWAYDISGVPSNPIDDDNIAYATHPYPIKDAMERENRSPYGCPDKWQTKFGNTAKIYPVIATEFGFEDINDDTWATKIWGADERWGRGIIAFIEERDIHWVVWSFSTFYGPTLLENMEEIGTTGEPCDGTVKCYEVNEAGAFFKQEMIRLNRGN